MKLAMISSLSLIFLMFVTKDGAAQNRISAAAGQNIVFVADSVRTSTILKLTNGILKIAGDRYLHANPNASQNNVIFGKNAGNLTMLGISNTFLGARAGLVNAGNTIGTDGSQNTFIGFESGVANQTGNSNTFVGRGSGAGNTSGDFNTFLGTTSGSMNTAGHSNTAGGLDAGFFLTTGSSNIFFGRAAGVNTSTGSNNTFVGTGAGYNNNLGGSGNVCIGQLVGPTALDNTSDKLFIHNAASATPLIFGNFGGQKLTINGTAGVATGNVPTSIVDVNSTTRNLTGFRLFVKGGIVAENVIEKVGWADYVFEPGYKLFKLEDVEASIKKDRHLPKMTSGKEIERNGAELGEITTLRQEKIEELTLYAIEQQKLLTSQASLLENQQQQLEHLEKEISKLLNDQNKK